MSNSSVRPKSWRRFTLRTLLVACAVVAFILGQYILRAQSQKRAVDWCLSQGGLVEYGYNYDFNKHESAAQTSPAWHTSETFRHYFSNVTRVEVKSDDSGSIPISKLSRLDRLALYDAKQVDLSSIEQLKKLKVLHLHGKQIEDLDPLASLHNLEQIGLTDLAATSLDPLSKLSKLQFVSLTTCDVESFEALTKMDNLVVIVIDRTEITNQQVEELRDALPDCVIQILRRPNVAQSGG